MKQLMICMGAIAMLLMNQCTSKPERFIVELDSKYEVAGQKFAVRDINPDLPRNWDGYNFVVLEYKITTPQRFHVGFTTDYGYNELRMYCYVPNAWNKLAIPLQFYRNLPPARSQLAAMFNQPRYTGWIHLESGTRGDLHGIDSIGIRMLCPINNPEFEIRNITLAVDDPGDVYLGEIPVIDEFGQVNLVDYPEKIHSLEQLRGEWAAEDKALAGSIPDYNYSKYGGYMQKQVKGTGFFRVEKVDGRWWFVDPEGYLYLHVAASGIGAGGGGNIRDMNKRGEMWLKEMPPEQFIQTNNQGVRTPNFGAWNLYRRYGGDNYREKALETTVKRMERLGVNVGTQSMASIGIPKPFTSYLRNLGMENELMGLADIYAPGWEAMLDSSLRATLPQEKDNPWIIGYFVGNEPGWQKKETQLCSLILQGRDRPIKVELEKYLQIHGNTVQHQMEFVHKTFGIFLQTVKKTMKRYDPNHLNLGIRFGNLNSLEGRGLLQEVCRDAFDIISINEYYDKPRKDLYDTMYAKMGLPYLIGEFHFGTTDRGLSSSLWQVDDQEERGVAYRYYMEQGYSHPALIGTTWFQWGDQDVSGRGDGENFAHGVYDVTDRGYKYMVEAMMETNIRLYDIHSGKIEPFNQETKRTRGHRGIPNLWNRVGTREDMRSSSGL
jgi:hypothetical protein